MRLLRFVLLGALVVGTLDFLDAVIYFGLRNGSTPIRIAQSIAAGWLGRASFRGGLPAAALGVATHFFIAFGIVLTYALASRRDIFHGALTRYPWLCGSLYGIGVYVFMNRVVIPLSAIGPQPFQPGPFVNGILIHVLGVGVPSALAAAAARRQSLRPVAPSL